MPFRTILNNSKLKSLSLSKRISLAKSILYIVNDQVFHQSLKINVLNNRVDINLSGSNHKLLSDLDGLQLLPLRRLNLKDTATKDLSPLHGTSIEILNLYKTPIMDLSPLRGTPLKELCLEASGVNDLSALAGSQIQKIQLGFRKANLSVLKNCRSLRVVEIPKNLYSKAELALLPKWAKVVYRDFSVK